MSVRCIRVVAWVKKFNINKISQNYLGGAPWVFGIRSVLYCAFRWSPEVKNKKFIKFTILSGGPLGSWISLALTAGCLQG